MGIQASIVLKLHYSFTIIEGGFSKDIWAKQSDIPSQFAALVMILLSTHSLSIIVDVGIAASSNTFL
ncbi:hypothetical protein BT96DRAFT_997859 [Gymnopus androsaceus JB14]|uniref:Uncharacterized protein n=1 Tax=Gymnopus androsaceus JB14 TaxID=1447944 RepID=A0A6A4HBZ4_9AGAR|nr:hypothetical protein BT96DRAFT_997859 [Gymnopus androsaceus JB14]